MAKLEELEVWKHSMQLAKKMYELSDIIKEKKDYGLCDQIRRSSVSIPSNIAEGVGRKTQKELIRFLIIARGSALELKTQIYLCIMFGYIPKESKYIDDITSQIKLINGMIRGISKQ